MKTKVPLPALIVVGIMMVGGLFFFGSRSANTKHHSSKPPVSVEQLRANNAATYAGRR